jgi:hypothetical protein
MTSALSLATSVPDPMAIPQGREKLSDRQCRQKSDGHRKFHCHLAVDNVLKGFFEDGVATDQSRSDANYADAREWLPNSKPDRSRSDYHEGNANEFSPLNSLRVSARPATRRRSFISWEFRSKALVGDFSIKGEGFIAKHSLAVLPKRLSQVRPHHVDHFICGQYLRRSRFLFSVKNMAPNVAFQKLGHQAVHRSPGSAHELQYVGAISFFGESAHKSFHLSLNALGP